MNPQLRGDGLCQCNKPKLVKLIRLGFNKQSKATPRRLSKRQERNHVTGLGLGVLNTL